MALPGTLDEVARLLGATVVESALRGGGMRWVLWMGLVFAGCDDNDTCSEANHELETAGCACEVDDDCTCRNYTGVGFVEDESIPWECEDGQCADCQYQ